jgi:dipeptidase E
MKLLLTSNGLSNDSIAHAFADLIGKNPSDTKVAFITTIAEAERANKDWLINDLHRLKRYGYDVDVIDIAVLAPADIIATVNAADAIFVGGGNSFQMSYWLQQSGLFELLPQLLKTKVYAGISAGSMLASHSLRLSSQALKQQGRLRDEDYNKLGPSGESSAKPIFAKQPPILAPLSMP